MVVLTNEEELKKQIREDLAKERVFDEKKVEERFNQIIAVKKEDLKALPAKSYVSVGGGKFSFIISGMGASGYLNIYLYSRRLRQEPSFGDVPEPQGYTSQTYANQSAESLGHTQGCPCHRGERSRLYDLAQLQV